MPSRLAIVVLALVAVLVVALPLAALVTAMWPSRVNRWAAALCAVATAAASAVVGIGVWERAIRPCPPDALECGDDSGLIFLLVGVPTLVAITNAAAGAAAWVRRPRRPTP